MWELMFVTISLTPALPEPATNHSPAVQSTVYTSHNPLDKVKVT